MRIKLPAALFAAVVAIAALAGLALAQRGDVQRGGELYNENCAVCHGDRGQGRIGATLNKEWPGINVDAFIQNTIKNGIKGTRMPAWGQANGGPLTDQDVEDIAAYVQALSGGTEPVAPDPTLAPQSIPTLAGINGDPGLGAVTFADNCAVCHGDKGQGRVGAALAKSWSGAFPEEYIRATVGRGIEGSVMPAWGQENGGPLSTAEIDDVTAYVLSLNPIGGAPTPAPASAGPISLPAGLIALLAVLLIVVAVGATYYRRSGTK